MAESGGNPAADKTKPSSKLSSAGQGIRSLDSTALFRITNFELFVKPNKFVMIAGLTAITLCGLYIGYMRYRVTSEENTYIALAEDGSQYIKKKSSKWE